MLNSITRRAALVGALASLTSLAIATSRAIAPRLPTDPVGRIDRAATIVAQQPAVL